MTKALLIGSEPPLELGYEYVTQPPYEAVVIGSLPLSQALRLSDDRVLQALAEGKPVVLYTPGLPAAPGNRALSAALAALWGARRLGTVSAQCVVFLILLSCLLTLMQVCRKEDFLWFVRLVTRKQYQTAG